MLALPGTSHINRPDLALPCGSRQRERVCPQGATSPRRPRAPPSPPSPDSTLFAGVRQDGINARCARKSHLMVPATAALLRILSVEEFGDGDTQSDCQLFDIVDGDVPRRPFDVRDERPVEAGRCREIFL
jgi:hypothetical protein